MLTHDQAERIRRRIKHLEARIKTRSDGQLYPRGDYDRAEASALRAALDEIGEHRSKAEAHAALGRRTS
jgi:hypothetical protein